MLPYDVGSFVDCIKEIAHLDTVPDLVDLAPQPGSFDFLFQALAWRIATANNNIIYFVAFFPPIAVHQDGIPGLDPR